MPTTAKAAPGGGLEPCVSPWTGVGQAFPKDLGVPQADPQKVDFELEGDELLKSLSSGRSGPAFEAGEYGDGGALAWSPSSPS
jgi:hypothetical protein